MPVAHSRRTSPVDHMSDANEYGAEQIRSGDMYLSILAFSGIFREGWSHYLKVPTKVPHMAMEFPKEADTPKSVTLTSPSELIKRFDGLMSL